MISGAALVAGVVGAPVAHSLSPVIHNAWIAGAGIDAAYVPFRVAPGGFARLVEGLRGGAVRGLNVTSPFKEAALALADRADPAAQAAGAANVLLFGPDGVVGARNTDGLGLLGALAAQAPRWSPAAGPVTLLGAGGAARGAAAALKAAGVAELRIVNRTLARAEGLARAVGGARACGWDDLADAVRGAALVVNATVAGPEGSDLGRLSWPAAPPGAAAMDMVYGPRSTGFLAGAEAAGRTPVDGLAMLVAQARPSFAAFYGREPPEGVDVRALCLARLGGGA